MHSTSVGPYDEYLFVLMKSKEDGEKEGQAVLAWWLGGLVGSLIAHCP